MSSVIRTLQHTVIVFFLLVTFAAFVYTMTRITLPGIPKVFTYWSYSMMAPYQGDVSWNADLYIEGELPDGTWEQVTLDRYMPHGFGERNVRKFFRMYGFNGDRSKRPMYAAYLLQVLDRERERGKPYKSLRAYFDQWDRSPAGFEFLHLPLFTSRQFITQVQ